MYEKLEKIFEIISKRISERKEMERLTKKERITHDVQAIVALQDAYNRVCDIVNDCQSLMRGPDEEELIDLVACKKVFEMYAKYNPQFFTKTLFSTLYADYSLAQETLQHNTKCFTALRKHHSTRH